MSIKFILDTSDYDSKSFIIRIKFPNGLAIDFESDLNNISSSEIKAFMERFRNNKKCCLDILNSKNNTVEISFDAKKSKIFFKTWNEGYTFADIETNYNIINIGFKINKTERDNFSDILEKLYKFMNDEDTSDEDTSEDEDEKVRPS